MREGYLCCRPKNLSSVDQATGAYGERVLRLLCARTELGSMTCFSTPGASVSFGVTCGRAPFRDLPVEAYRETVHRNESSLIVLSGCAWGSVPQLCSFAFGERVVVASEAGGADPSTRACAGLKKLGFFGVLCAVASTFLPAV